MLIYLTPYLCKPENTMGELMKKSPKETHGKEVAQKLDIRNVFLTNCEVLPH